MEGKGRGGKGGREGVQGGLKWSPGLGGRWVGVVGAGRVEMEGNGGEGRREVGRVEMEGKGGEGGREGGLKWREGGKKTKKQEEDAPTSFFLYLLYESWF